MSERWTLGDVLDYEYFLGEDLDSPSAGENLRTWYRSYKGKPESGRILHSWLRFRQGLHQAVLPGKTVNRLYRIVSIILAIIGLSAGTGLGWAVLSYAGNNPVNLFMALVVLVGIPLLLTSVSLLLTLLPLGSNRSRRLTDRLMRFLRGAVGFSRRMGIVDRAHADAVLSGISRFRGRSVIYKSLFRWSVSLPIQLRTFSFHMGIFIAVFWRGIVQDVAFAWQTTLRVSPVDIHRIIVFISWPWRMLVSPPTQVQVAGSRIILKDGIEGLNNADLIAWWPFLCFAILAYGVLPRLLLLIYCLLRRKLTLGSLSFSDSRSHRLLLIMKAARVNVAGSEPPRELEDKLPAASLPVTQHKAMSIHVLFPSLRDDLKSEESWKNYLSEQWGAGLSRVTAVSLDDEEDSLILESLAGCIAAVDGILLVFEGWRPYTAAAGLYVEAIQSLMPGGVTILIALAGRPGRGFDMEERDYDTLNQWKRMLPADVLPGACEIVELKSWR